MSTSLDDLEPNLRERFIRFRLDIPQCWIEQSYRDIADQIRKRKAYEHFLKFGSPWAPLAAIPGTSNHGKTDKNGRPAARAVDVGMPGGYTKGNIELTQRVAARYGLYTPIRSELHDEPWHFEVAPNAKPLPPLTKEQAMTIAVQPVAAVRAPMGLPGGWIFGRRGHVYTFEGAQNYGGWPEGEAGPDNRSGRDCVALVPSRSGRGYFLVSDTGEVYAYGDALYPGNYQKAWGDFPIIGAYANDSGQNGGLTLIRDDGQNLNTYNLYR